MGKKNHKILGLQGGHKFMRTPVALLGGRGHQQLVVLRPEGCLTGLKPDVGCLVKAFG